MGCYPERMRFRRYFVFALGLLAVGLYGNPTAATASFNLAPLAHVDASSWSLAVGPITATADAEPRLAIDGDTATGWKPDAQAKPPHWLLLDFTRPWPMTLRWSKLVAHWLSKPPDYRWEVSHDGVTWKTLAIRSKATLRDSVAVDGEGEYLRLVISGEPVALLEIEAYSASRGSGAMALPRVSFSGNLANIRWDGGTERNVITYRLYRNVALKLGESGAASMRPRIIEAPVLSFDDRVEFPSPSLPLVHSWTVEAIGPDGGRIGTAKNTPVFEILHRSPKPFVFRGIVEGYYGPPFTRRERLELVRFAGNQGANFYLYAPKLDPLHRERWREPYPDQFYEQFRELVTVAQEHGVTIAYGLSPGLDSDFTNPADRAAALAKLQRFLATGVRWFALLMDDIPAAPGAATAEAQVAFVNSLFESLLAENRECMGSKPECFMLFVPTVYAGSSNGLTGPEQAYLQALQNLRMANPQIPIAWTGPAVFSANLSHADVDPIALLTMHSLLLWDNYPVNDVLFSRSLHLGPVQGRSSDLGDPVAGQTYYVAGLLANPLWQSALNRIPLTSVFAYLREPQNYRPEQAYRAAWQSEAPPEVAALFQDWGEAFRIHEAMGVTESTTTKPMREAMAALQAGRLPGTEFARQAAIAYVAEANLDRLYRNDLANALLPFARKAALLGEAKLRSLQHLAAGHTGKEAAEAVHHLVTAARQLPWVVNAGLDERWLSLLGNAPKPAIRGPQLTGAVPQRVVVNQWVDVGFQTDTTAVTLVGLEGSILKTNRLRWKPQRPGRDRWALIATSGAEAGGTNVLFGEVDVFVPAERTTFDTGCSCSWQQGGATDLLPVLTALLVLQIRRSRRPFGPKLHGLTRRSHAARPRPALESRAAKGD